MRLIDADALIKDLQGTIFYADSIPFVEEAPTAYDVEKVVENVRCLCYSVGLDESQTEIIVAEIVKGGVDNADT